MCVGGGLLVAGGAAAMPQRSAHDAACAKIDAAHTTQTHARCGLYAARSVAPRPYEDAHALTHLRIEVVEQRDDALVIRGRPESCCQGRALLLRVLRELDPDQTGLPLGRNALYSN